MSIGEHGNVRMKKLRVYTESMRRVATQNYQNSIYQMVSEVEKEGRRIGKNIPQGSFPEDLMLQTRKLQNSRRSVQNSYCFCQ